MATIIWGSCHALQVIVARQLGRVAGLLNSRGSLDSNAATGCSPPMAASHEIPASRSRMSATPAFCVR